MIRLYAGSLLRLHCCFHVFSNIQLPTTDNLLQLNIFLTLIHRTPYHKDLHSYKLPGELACQPGIQLSPFCAVHSVTEKQMKRRDPEEPWAFGSIFPFSLLTWRGEAEEDTHSLLRDKLEWREPAFLYVIRYSILWKLWQEFMALTSLRHFNAYGKARSNSLSY
jgi:hypothetical protein